VPVQKFPFLSRVKTQNVLERLMLPAGLWIGYLTYVHVSLFILWGIGGIESFFFNLVVSIFDWVVDFFCYDFSTHLFSYALWNNFEFYFLFMFYRTAQRIFFVRLEVSCFLDTVIFFLALFGIRFSLLSRGWMMPYVCSLVSWILWWPRPILLAPHM